MVDHKGLTVLELSVSLGILSALTVCAYPALADWSRKIGFRSEVASLMHCLHRAKLEAIKTNSYVVFEAKPDGYYAFVYGSSSPRSAGDWTRQPEDRQIIDCTLKKGLTLASTFPKDRMRFSGRPGISAGRFIVTDSRGSRMDVILSASGRIRVE